MYHLTVLTPEKIVYEGTVIATIVPGSLGFFEILSNHAPIISSIKPGELQIVEANHHKISYMITGGLFEFSQNKATVLADGIESQPDSDTVASKSPL